MAQSKRAKVANYLCRLNFRSPLGSANDFSVLRQFRLCRFAASPTFLQWTVLHTVCRLTSTRLCDDCWAVVVMPCQGNHPGIPAFRNPSLRRSNCCRYFSVVSFSGTGARLRKLPTVTSG